MDVKDLEKEKEEYAKKISKLLQTTYAYRLSGLSINENLTLRNNNIIYFSCYKKIDIDYEDPEEELNIHVHQDADEIIKQFKRDYLSIICEEDMTDKDVEDMINNNLIQFKCKIEEDTWTTEDYTKELKAVKSELIEMNNKIKEYEEQQNKYKNV